MKKYRTDYGYFSETGDEYIITNYKTPKPWVNVISNGNYGLIISQTGGGFSWDTHSEFNRINRWHQDLVQDNWGKYFYIKNNKTGEFFSPLFTPVRKAPDYYEARYGIGYAIFSTIYNKIKIELRIFVPFNDNLEIWDFKVENQTDNDLDLSIYSYFEWCLGSSADHHREFHKTFIETEFDDLLNAMIAKKRLWDIPLGPRGHWNIDYPYLGFISSNKNISDYEGDKEKFIGQYGSLENPRALNNAHLSKSIGKWNDSIATIKIDIYVKKNEFQKAAFYIGLKENKDQINKTIARYWSEDQIDDSFTEVKLKWAAILDPFEINTPDDAMNFMVNKWLRYQAISGRLWGRTGYYQQSGAFGFRDQLQDSLVFLPVNPALTKKQILLHARHQKQDGTVLHWWHPITETGMETKMTDDLLWLPFVLFQYLTETSDYTILDENIPYYDKPYLQDSLFTHCAAAIEKVFSRYSKRGLPLIGAGDWNDGLSAVGLDMNGESIWLAEFFYLILKEFAGLCENLNKTELSKKYKSKAGELKEAFNKYSWDGEWFYRATKDNGEKIGSSENNEGKIYLNPQTWSVISGIADDNKSRSALTAVKKYLLKNNGPVLLAPAYTEPDKYIGYLSRYAPGRRENGGVYTHAATWAIWAFALLKETDVVYDIYKKLNPVFNGMDPVKYSSEPFVTPGNIDGPDSPNYGMGGWSWYTGSAAWFQKIIVDWILGVRATDEGLLIDPCIPKEWDHYSVKRTFRGTIYRLVIDNSRHKQTGIKYIDINGLRIEGNIIPFCHEKEIVVNIFM
jgi:cellobiose phosphorylase